MRYWRLLIVLSALILPWAAAAQLGQGGEDGNIRVGAKITGCTNGYFVYDNSGVVGCSASSSSIGFPQAVTGGTSGGVPYFSSATQLSASAALAINQLVIGGGAGAAPSTVTTGTGVLAALAANVGSAGAPIAFNGAGGTPLRVTLTNGTVFLSRPDLRGQARVSSRPSEMQPMERSGFPPKMGRSRPATVSSGDWRRGCWLSVWQRRRNSVLSGHCHGDSDERRRRIFQFDNARKQQRSFNSQCSHDWRRRWGCALDGHDGHKRLDSIGSQCWVCWSVRCKRRRTWDAVWRYFDERHRPSNFNRSYRAGTGVLAALGVNVGSAGAFVVNGGAGGTPSSITLTNGTGLPLSGLTDRNQCCYCSGQQPQCRERPSGHQWFHHGGRLSQMVILWHSGPRNGLWRIERLDSRVNLDRQRHQRRHRI